MGRAMNKFVEWSKDLTDRCDEHLRMNPESPAEPKIKSGLVCITSDGPDGDIWRVTKDDQFYVSFAGPGALQKAIDYADTLFN